MLKHFEPWIEQVSLIPSQGGRFEVEINGILVYSKLASGRHANAGEIIALVRNFLEERHDA